MQKGSHKNQVSSNDYLLVITELNNEQSKYVIFTVIVMVKRLWDVSIALDVILG